ncbi:hypothetical protein [Azonexus sp. IMCC34839]|uniref:hypothetical protein n=1 Tax=Azonexus sp. IMCC34839 TaxID=3133695 RepID=UPI00399A89E8
MNLKRSNRKAACIGQIESIKANRFINSGYVESESGIPAFPPKLNISVPSCVFRPAIRFQYSEMTSARAPFEHFYVHTISGNKKTARRRLGLTTNF